MQSCKEWQGEIRKPSSVNNEKKQRKIRTGKTRDLFKKIRDTKGIFHAKMSTIKDRNSKDLTEAEEIKKVARIQKNYTKKGLNDLDNYNSVAIHLEPDILECEVILGLRKHHYEQS